jgi:3-deoxy-D-manno-octulosonate 8-phosphate phosphatase (KDO 8-P phosphatase)
MSLEILQKIKPITCLIMDIDGIFNDGRIYFDKDGEECSKPFHAHDGMGLRLLQERNILLAVISGRLSMIAKARFEFLNVHDLYLGHFDKMPCYEDFKKKRNLKDAQIAYIGDDLPDLPCMEKAGLAITVPNAMPEVLARADWVTKTPGGHGAIREVCNLFLKA